MDYHPASRLLYLGQPRWMTAMLGSYTYTPTPIARREVTREVLCGRPLQTLGSRCLQHCALRHVNSTAFGSHSQSLFTRL